MKKRFCAVAAVMIFAAAELWAQTAFAFRCGTRLISEGDRLPRVLEFCGEPDHVDTWQEELVFKRHYHSHRHTDRQASDRLSEPESLWVKKYVTVEQWTYNLGTSRLVRYLTFENGLLVRITTGEHGY